MDHSVNPQGGVDRQMKSFMPDVVANDRLRDRLCNDIYSGKLTHAYIIEGAVGSGRHTLALNIAKAVACENRSSESLPLPCGVCSACRKISEGICPDVITVGKEEDKATIGVESARFIRGDVVALPNDLDVKFYIIEDADRLTAQAQNALLLTLEDPPSFAVFLLLCERAELLLETVRSRAPTIRTEPVPRDAMSSHLLSSAPAAVTSAARQLKQFSPQEFEEILTASAGCIGRAYELLDPHRRGAALESRGKVRDFVDRLIDSSSHSALIDAVSAFPQKRDELIEYLEIVTLALRDLIVSKKSDDAELCFYSNREYVLELSQKRSAAKLLQFVESCDRAIDALNKNANVKLTVTTLVASLG